ncbi:ribosomal-protein-alanine N-acetyltransferase [Streptomyces spiroverticillatus]|uniref:Ribosomal-protein-alanine N-acetyltransferase n=1 Tax=Streptomyces finlayi TaxID=67296 RepID=A0A919C980_9ACTN|nr:GNAT family N-acetyltransferase [Streptomyces finlayi]GHA06492.1 ribosomal-protein-alanine N-acetyltransferase [Streptomyces spiroverticillatus]GHC90042.1 ribosomal-protein-alanine N-acetyltransferase [Streptomyces finlayi]
MITQTHALPDGVALRLATLKDAEALAEAVRENREHLSPWEPRWPESYFTTEGQAERLRDRLVQHEEGRLVPWLMVREERVVGAVTLSGIVRGPFCSAYLGYWVAADQLGRGLASGAVRHVCEVAGTQLGLHRIEATTVLHNVRSQRVLEKCGFEAIGSAPRYLHIDGEWRDHRIFQRILHDGPPAM